ncbi:hypothetical protein Acy02nite_57790 [Actinoplanes cyaneus]|uniref:Uncharacterized protein n=1 Tax=Actinoplanes cyaneus TaxID=52696 RepID=A0A919M813_9ACTN|nr:hypothetical protein [Actinoplanes cyaneus]MCW2139813.1 hypothetical protein [Actinoplanes cyaneus]GID67898.1 hypothetical protein Acy02nite_57790 [Actinoplanes cyaneus]
MKLNRWTRLGSLAMGMIVLTGLGAAPATADSSRAVKIGKTLQAATAGHADEAVAAAGNGNSIIEYRDQRTDVQVPRNARDGVSITGAAGTLKIGLPAAASAAAGVQTSKGTVVYADRGRAADVAVQTMTEGARVLVTMANASAPKEYRFPLTLPAGTELAATADGSVTIVKRIGRGTAVLGTVEAPWAKDAKGSAIKTHYRVAGSSLVQTVDTDAHTAYPVVADPSISFGRFVYVRFSKREIQRIPARVFSAGASAVIQYACGLIPNPLYKRLCKGMARVYVGSVYNTFRAARRAKQCVELKYNYTPQLLVGWRRYSC